MGTPQVSVIVCTFDRAGALGAALESVAAQQTGGEFSYETVVVDDASTDATEAVARQAALTLSVPVRYIRESGRGVPFARNRGVSEAYSEWIAFFDDDQIAERGWLSELMRVALDKKAAIVGGARQLEFLSPPPFDLGRLTREVLGEKLYGASVCPSTRFTLACTGNVLIRRDVFDRIGRFDTDMTQGMSDIDLTRRALDAGVDSWYAPGAVVRHLIPPHRLSEDYLRWTCLRVGANHSRINFKSRGTMGMLLPSLLRAGHSLFLNPVVTVAAHLARKPGMMLERKCYRWIAEGSARMALHLTSPALFPQGEFLGHLAFRAERHAFGVGH